MSYVANGAVPGTPPVPLTSTINGQSLASPIILSKSNFADLNLVDNTSDATKDSNHVSLTNHTFDTSLNTLTIGANLSLFGHRLTNLPNIPIDIHDAINQTYVDNRIAGFLNKITAVVATTTGLPAYMYNHIGGLDGVGDTITASSNGSLTIDMHLTVLNDYILVKNETDAQYNGVYNVTTAGVDDVPGPGVKFVLTRAVELDQQSEFAGASVFISGGSTNLSTTWTCTTSTPIVGSDPIAFTQSGASTSYSAGIGITLSGTEFLIDTTIVPQKHVDDLSVFAPTTSAQLAGVINDETGSGLLVFNNSPSLTTPTITGSTNYMTSGDNFIISTDASKFREGQWALLSSGTLYALLGPNLAMKYWTHNAPIDTTSGDFLTRDENGDACSLWAYTENNIEKTFYNVPGSGVPSVWTLQRQFDLTTGNAFFAGNLSIGGTIGSPAAMISASGQITSTIVTGTAPFVVASTTQVANLNAATAGTATNATNVNLANDAANATDYLVFTNTATGNQPLKTNVGISVNPNTATITATTFSGALSGNATTATTATTATNATNIAITDDTSTNATMYPTWVTANSSNLPQKVSSTKLTFNPSTGALSSTSFTGAGTGLTGTAASLTAGNVTTNANLTGVITSVGNTTSIASQTGTGSKFVVDTSPTLVTPNIGVATGTKLTLSAGTTTVAPIVLTAGTNLTTAAAGAREFDGTAYYETVDTTNGRTQDSNQNIFRLTANGSAIGPGIADFFGSNSAIPTATNGVYEITFYLFYLKSTAGTVTYTITNTQTYTNLVASFVQSTATGIGAVGSADTAGIVSTTTAAAALPATASLTSAADQAAVIRCLAECETAGNIRLRVTSSAGTITPLRGSYYTVRRLFAGNVGAFVA